MRRAYVSIGSNIDPRANVTKALDELARRFGPLEVSTVYESDAVGFFGPAFLNLVVGFDSDMTPARLVEALREVEDACGRERSGPRFSSRTLDVDLLLLGNLTGMQEGVELPRPEAASQAFVLIPLAELAADRVDPASGKTYGELADSLSGRAHGMRRLAGVLT